MNVVPPSGPRVSVGMPVHNGASTLPRALESVLSQSHRNLDVIVSDNGSTDDTPSIAQKAAARDPRVRYFRQEQPMSAWENFRFVLEQATGDYFFWAADDDVHSPNYVEALLGALCDRPGAVLAVADMVRFHQDEEPTSGSPAPAMSAEDLRTDASRLRHVILSTCSDFYGLFRTRCLREFPWTGFDYGPDHILLFYVRMRGEVVHAPGAVFYESIRRSPRPRRERVRQGFYSSMGRFRMVRFSWHMARVAHVAAPHEMPAARRLRIFARSYYILRLTLAKTYLYEHAPLRMVGLWRRVKSPPPELQPTP
jgi:glycosyltransferase involved in cell wall biosynthesis